MSPFFLLVAIVGVTTEPVFGVFVMLVIAAGAFPSQIIASDVADDIAFPFTPVAGNVGEVLLVGLWR
jgi:ABC-type sulfate transport system permease subunit